MMILTTALTIVIANLPTATPADLMLRAAKDLSAQITNTLPAEPSTPDNHMQHFAKVRRTRNIAVAHSKSEEISLTPAAKFVLPEQP